MLKYENAKCTCGFDLSSVEPEVYHETHPGEYMGHCPSCRGVAQPVVEGEPKKPKAGSQAEAKAKAEAEAKAQAKAEAEAEAAEAEAAEAEAKAEAEATAEAAARGE